MADILAENTLRELLEDIAEDTECQGADIKVKAITSGGANYTSALFLATIANGVKELNLFAKVAIVGEKMREVMNAEKMFGAERFFYNKLAKTYESLQEKHKVSEEDKFVFPKFYGCNPDLFKETVVLENLVARGFKSFNRFKSLDWDHAAVAVEMLAKFHALSFAYKKENPEEFQEVIEEFRFEKPKRGDEFKEIWTQMIQRALAVIREEYRGKVVKFLENGGETMFVKYNTPQGTPVLIHGDYRPSNLLFKHEDGKAQVVPVDFQTLRNGCPATDLVYFVFVGSDASFRAQHYQRLAGHYHLQLQLALARLGMDAAEVYPREQFDSDMELMLPYGILLGIAILPIVTVEAEHAPRVDGDADASGFSIKPNELYAERFGGIIDDMVKWGVI